VLQLYVLQGFVRRRFILSFILSIKRYVNCAKPNFDNVGMVTCKENAFDPINDGRSGRGSDFDIAKTEQQIPAQQTRKHGDKCLRAFGDRAVLFLEVFVFQIVASRLQLPAVFQPPPRRNTD